MYAWLTGNVPPANEYVCRRVRIPNDIGLVSAVSGALIELTKEYKWEQFGTLTPEECARIMTDMFSEYMDSNCMIGTIQAYITTNPPNGCLVCDGTTYDKADYPTLYDLLDPVYQISGTQFVTPDLRGQFLLGENGSHAIGDTGGAETVTLTVDEIPSHNHGYTHPNMGVVTVGLEPPLPAVTSVTPLTATTSTGGDEPHENMPPFTVVRYCIIAR